MTCGRAAKRVSNQAQFDRRPHAFAADRVNHVDEPRLDVLRLLIQVLVPERDAGRQISGRRVHVVVELPHPQAHARRRRRVGRT
jgi:hypothetical protein